jgi:hypothetical protein
MKKLALLFAFLLPCLAQQPQPVPLPLGSTVAGTITGDDGTLIEGALVGLALLPTYSAGRLRETNSTFITGIDGTFQFNHLVSGSYQICVQVPGSVWLNPCEWGLQQPVISLAGGQSTTGVAVVLKKGALVPIHLGDPGGLLSQYASAVPGAQVLIGVSNDALFFRRAPLTSTDAGGRNHQTLIPFGVTVNLIVCTSFFQVSDAAGIALPMTSAAIPITVQPGQVPSAVTLVVTGVSLP